MSRKTRLLAELADAEAQVRRLGRCLREKKEREDGAAAEVSALHHLAEVRKIVELRA